MKKTTNQKNISKEKAIELLSNLIWETYLLNKIKA